MLFNSEAFLMFFPLVVLGYYIIPHRMRYIWIFISSCFFYMCWNIKYGFLLITVIAITYLAGVLIEKVRTQNDHRPYKKDIILIALISVCILSLAYFKYLSFLLINVGKIWKGINNLIDYSTVSIVIPVGVSFYLFQSMGYVIDIYRGNIRAEKNFLRYAAYISFFSTVGGGAN